MVEVAPLTPQLPCVTITRTSFDASVRTVSSKFVVRDRSVPISCPSVPPPIRILASGDKGPSEAVDKTIRPIERFTPQVDVLSSRPNFPSRRLAVEPTAPPTGTSSARGDAQFSGTSTLVRTATPIVSFFHETPWPAAAASSV